MFSKHVSDKALISRIQKELNSIVIKKTNVKQEQRT
jgi:hypothetical protein